MALVTRLRKYNIFYFGGLTEFDAILEERLEKMTDFWKIILDSCKCQKYIEKGSGVSLVLVRRLRNYNPFYFGSFTEFDVMSDERPELS